jgi:hypothetical protein
MREKTLILFLTVLYRYRTELKDECELSSWQLKSLLFLTPPPPSPPPPHPHTQTLHTRTWQNKNQTYEYGTRVFYIKSFFKNLYCDSYFLHFELPQLGNRQLNCKKGSLVRSTSCSFVQIMLLVPELRPNLDFRIK